MTQEINQVISKQNTSIKLSGNSLHLSGKPLFRFEHKLHPLSILNWMRSQRSDSQTYWACRRGDLEIGAIGLVDSIDSSNTQSLAQAFSVIESRLNQIAFKIRYYGGHCFDPERIDSIEWKGFGSYRFVLPEYELIRNGDDYTFAWNCLSESTEKADLLEQKFQETIEKLSMGVSQPEVKAKNSFLRKDVPSQAEWMSVVERLTGAIKSGQIDKVVLARKVDLEFASLFDPFKLFEFVKERFSQAYSFFFRFPKSGIYLGCSPECLVEKHGSDIFTEALAGTRPIASDPDENQKLQEELYQSAKERQEHAYVSDHIRSELESFCEQIHCPESFEIINAVSVQHLLTRFRAKLSEKADLYHIINALHPTAAVNGVPSSKAMQTIRSVEPFSRGWYAGSVGWIMSDNAQFATAIRSALIQNCQTLSVYAGAGLVQDSDPHQEWQETEHKLRPILEAAEKISC